MVDCSVAHNVEMKSYNTMRLNPIAKELLIPTSENAIKEIFSECTVFPIIIGEGSNTIFAADHYDSIVYMGLMKKIEIKGDVISAQCGVTLHDLAWFALQNEISGYEYLEDIPGSVGGALCMNAGTYENYISKQVLQVRVFDIEKKEFIELSREDLADFWGKRESYFTNHRCCIVSCDLYSGKRDTSDKILENMLAIKKNRYSKQPRNYPNAGSVFKRPYVDGEPRYVWKLIDEAGLRGKRIGDAQISEKHPGFIVNIGNATGRDITELLEYCQKTIEEKFHISLQAEWVIC